MQQARRLTAHFLHSTRSEESQNVALARPNSTLPLQNQNSLQNILIFAIICLCLSTRSFGQHPVPLDKNVDSAKCLECHEDKSKGKNVHSAIAMGCTTCHEVRVNKDVTRVKLTTTTVSSLCFTCHADKNPDQIKGPLRSWEWPFDSFDSL